MFGWLTRTRARTRAPHRPPSPRARPCVEELEPRYCLDALSLTLNFQELAGNQVKMTGHVTDTNANPGAISLRFTGKAAGMTMADGNGDFAVTSAASGLGAITATATDVPGFTGQIT